MKLIMNADDYGYSRGVNYGIIDSCNMGIVRSTTIMTNMPGFSHGAELASQTPTMGVGVHLVLTCGRALTGVNKTITDDNGNFLKLDTLTNKISQIDLDEVEKEYTAQIERAVSGGIIPTHIDSHHHTHMLPGIFNVFLKISAKYNLPIRLNSKDLLPSEYKNVKYPDIFTVDFFGENTGIDSLMTILEKYKDSDSVVEVMCHPAYGDQEILNGSSYNIQRTKELEVLRGKEIINYIEENNIKLVNYKDL